MSCLISWRRSSRLPRASRSRCRSPSGSTFASSWSASSRSRPYCRAWAQGGRIPLFVLPAAPGSGKSHLLWTIAVRGALPPDGDGRHPKSLDGEWQRAVDECSPAFRQQLDESIGVTVSFNTMADIDVDLEQKSSASTLIACRMLHSHFAAASSGLGRPLPYRDLLKFLMAHRLRR